MFNAIDENFLPGGYAIFFGRVGMMAFVSVNINMGLANLVQILTCYSANNWFVS